MSLLTPYLEARRTLGLDDAEADAAAIKDAYRRALAGHPPDTDPEGFRRIRAAYELLRDPWSRAAELLDAQLPTSPPPRPPAEVPRAPRGATAVALLRLAVARADVTAWSEPPPPPRRRAKPDEPR